MLFPKISGAQQEPAHTKMLFPKISGAQQTSAHS